MNGSTERLSFGSLTLVISALGVLAAAGCGSSSKNASPPIADGGQTASQSIETRAVLCGGSPGLLPACPGAGQCVNDPMQTPACSPPGLNECVGMCQCRQTTICAQGLVFDTSPDVCACVTPPAMPPRTVICGGLVGRPCPGAGQCQDDPNDGCDPRHGGADCSGICHCIDNVLFVQGRMFDSSPGVCACVPS